jgi:lysophospholipase L1-like esterase
MKTGLVLSALSAFLQLTACSKPNTHQVTPSIDTVASPTNTLKTYLALGDSYTIGQSVPSNQNYPNQTVAILNDSGIYFNAPKIIATTGWTTQDLLNATANTPVPTHPYDIVTLLIGVNNQYQGRSQEEYKTQFTTLLQQSIAYAGNKPSHVIVLSIPDYSVTPYGKNTGMSAFISSQIDSFNLINKQVTDSFNVNYLDITSESRKVANDSALIASDGLHYSGKEYAIWSTMLASLFANIVK